MIGQIIIVGQIILVGRMMDIYCLGEKTCLICGPKEAELSNILFWCGLAAPKRVYWIVWIVWASFGPQINQVLPPRQ